ncbi:MAG: GNAT family N-acetyltransferase [Pseudomonadota bacterium]
MIEVSETRDVAACLAIRRAVFIEEQGVDEAIEMDGLEEQGIHVLAAVCGAPVGCARILLSPPVGKVGRVAVLKSHRGTGIGQAVMAECERLLREKSQITEIRLGAQSYVVRFYEALGYRVDGAEYIEADIPHRPMVMEIG